MRDNIVFVRRTQHRGGDNMKNRVAEFRNELSLNQEELAYSAGISRPHLSEIENDKADPGGEVMFRIAKALEKKVEDVFFASCVVCTQQKEGE